MRKDVNIADFLTKDEIEAAEYIYKYTPAPQIARRIRDCLIEPNFERIQKALKRDDVDSLFLGYAVEHTLLLKNRKPKKSTNGKMFDRFRRRPKASSSQSDHLSSS